MASNLSLSFIPEFHLPLGNFHKTFQRVSLFGLHPLCSFSDNQIRKSISSCRGRSAAIRVINQEVVQSPSSESIRESKTDPVASSKLVLVVGASGGVGMFYLNSPLHFSVEYIWTYMMN